MAKVDVISSCSFGMATNATSNTRIELTPLDLRLIPYSPMQGGLIYHKPDQPQEFEFETFIHHMKKSLARTLDFYPPLAGRLGVIKNDDDYDNMISVFLDCNNAGVEFTHAIAHGVRVSDILKPTYVPEIVSSFFLDKGLTNYEGISNPLLAVQITELVDGYFMGITGNHVVVDGHSFWQFINSWAEISRGCDSISNKPVFEHNWYPSNNSTHNFIPVPSKHNFSLPPLLDRMFHFSRENLAKLKAKANHEAGTDKISSLQAVSAHLWRSVTRIRHQVSRGGSGYDQEEMCYCFLAVSLRGRIPNFPDGYLGNTSFPVTFATSEAELLSNGLGWAALKLNEMVAQVSTEKAAVKFLEEWVLKKPNVITKSNINFISVTGTPWFDVFGNDFGWGKPVGVQRGASVKADGSMIVGPAPESSGGGLYVLACLDPQVMQAMGKDPEFMESQRNGVSAKL